MIVWGGWGDEEGQVQFNDGAAFDPRTNTWRMIADSPLSPRSGHLAVWTGAEMLIVGGGFDGAAYDPASDSWRPITDSPIDLPNGGTDRVSAVWAEDRLVVWDATADEIAAYEPGSDLWFELPPTGFDSHQGRLRWDGEGLFAFATAGQFPSFSPLEARRLDDGGWTELASVESVGREVTDVGLVVWDGTRFVFYDRGASATYVYDAPADSWIRAAPPTFNPCEAVPAPVAADGIVYAPSFCGDNSIYESATETWTTTRIVGHGDARYTVWTGEELLTWGDPCCFGTSGTTPIEVSAWRYDITTQARQACEVTHEVTKQGELIAETRLAGSDVWALGQGIEPDSIDVRTIPTILFRVPDGAEPSFSAEAPDRSRLQPQTAESRAESSWARPGREWLTSWRFDRPGCWTIEVEYAGETAQLVVEVNPG